MRVHLPEVLRGRRIVVTGGCGFIGSHLVEALWRENRVVVIDDLSAGCEDNIAGCDVDLHRRSVAEPLDELLAGAEYVFHLAASVEVVRSLEDPAADARANVLGVVNVLQAVRRTGVRRLVYSSSAAVYGVPRELPVGESHPAEPISPYGLSKLTGERYLRLFYELEGLPAVALRYFNVYGPRQRADSPYTGVISIFATNRLNGRPTVVYGDGEQTRDFVHVSDVVRANLAAAVAPLEQVGGRAFNIGTGRRTTVNWLVAALGLPEGSVSRAPARSGDIRHSVADVSLAEEVLGFRARVALEQGLGDYLDYLGGGG